MVKTVDSFHDLKRKLAEYNPPVLEGKVPPHDLDAEGAVLSAVLLDPEAIDKVADLKPEHFYAEAHRRIYEACVELQKEAKPTDTVTVATYLKDTNRLAQVGGMPYLGSILDSAPVVNNVATYAKTVIEKHRIRRVILECQRFAARGYGDYGKPDAFISELGSTIEVLATGNPAADRFTTAAAVMRESYDRTKSAYEQGRPPGISTGFREYDKLTSGGLHRSDLTIVAARPGAGKTAFMCTMLLNVADCKPMLMTDDGSEWEEQACGFFSVEMPRVQIGNRLLAIESGVAGTRIRTGRLDDDDWSPFTTAARKIADLPIWIDDTSGLTLHALRAKVRRIKIECARRKERGRPPAKLAAIFVDYLQIMKADARTRIEEIGLIARGLKALAKDEDIAVVVGCQINRAVETRAGSKKKPVLSDLRESGEIEQEADNVIGMYRGAYYGEKDPEGEDGRTELDFLKQRNGPTKLAVVRYEPACTRFDNMPGY